MRCISVYCFLMILFSVLLCIFRLVQCYDESGGCFCKLKGRIDDCTCSVDTVDYFNNAKIYPRLNSLLLTDYFRYMKVNLNHPCPFWADDSKCAIQDCSVKTCPEERLPPGLKESHRDSDFKPSPKKVIDNMIAYLHKIIAYGLSFLKVYLVQDDDDGTCDENHGGLGAINKTISQENYEEFQKWQEHDDLENNFCYLDDESSANLQYVDLLLNPERYTGYKGYSAHRIWNTIYKENCFELGSGFGPYTTTKNLNSMCLEKRTFYRAISGLHSSISIHLCSQYFTKARSGFGTGEWGPNIAEFKRRFDPAFTDGEGPQWLRNLYFLYLLELRALAKASAYFENEYFYTGNHENDREVKMAVKELLSIAKSFPNHFNESVMFSGDESAARKLKEEFRQHFLNISVIMNCVGCDKCRLWGKIQIQGLGTALKILFSSDVGVPHSNKVHRFHLSRTEIVSLFNAFGRLSNSVFQLESFRKRIHGGKDEL